MAGKKSTHIKSKKKQAPTRAVRQGLFLKAFSKTGIISDGTKAAGIERSTFYLWKEDPTFLERFNEAEKQAEDTLEKEAVRRAKTGTLKPVFYQGGECGQVREFSDTLLMFVLKGRNPEKWRDKSPIVIGNKDDKPFQISGIIDVFSKVAEMTNEEIKSRLDEIKRSRGEGSPD